MSKNESYMKPAKHVPIAHFYKQSNETNNINSNRHDVLTDGMEIDAENE